MCWLIACVIVTTLFTLYLATLVVVALWTLWERKEFARTDFRPGVTILKPLAGLDEELAINLESFAQLDYEPLQLIFCTQDIRDPAYAVAADLARRYPHRDILVMVGDQERFGSPKVASLTSMLVHARHPFVMASDSNVRMAPRELQQLIQPLQDERIGMVYQPIAGMLERSASAVVENLRFSEFSGMVTIAARCLTGIDPVTGKGMLFRRAALASIGDFTRVADCGAEDYVIAQELRKAGWKLFLSGEMARVIHRDWPWKKMLQRHLRHSCMRCRLEPWAYPLELLANPIAFALLFLPWNGARGLALLALTVVLKIVLENVAHRLLRGQFYRLRHWPLVVVKDLLMFGLWWAAIFYDRVEWRGRAYRVTWGSRLIPLDPVPQATPAPEVSSPWLEAR